MGSDDVFVRRGGDGPALLLLHGLGATSDVWDGLSALLPGHWPGSWIVPDLPGHGRSAPAHRNRYSIGGLAAAVATVLEPGAPLVAIGHSLGGGVALALASGWYQVHPSAVLAIGIKARWSAEELAKAAELAARPARLFATREEAADRALKVAGLTGLVPPDAPFVDAAVVPTDGGWGLALDQAAFAVGAPAMEGLLAAARGAVVLAAGEHDPMSPVEHLEALVPDPVVLKGLGHNAHVEDPAALVPLIDRLAASAGSA